MTESPQQRRPSAKSDECPYCGQKADEPCISWRGEPMQRRHAVAFGLRQNDQSAVRDV